jgi:hypothetical protein
MKIVATAKDLNTFNLNGTEAQIATRHGCKTVTISGGHL